MTTITLSNYDENKTLLSSLLKDHQHHASRNVFENIRTFSFSAINDKEMYLGGIIGSITDEVMHIELLSVLPDTRGLGIGAQLIKQALNHAETIGCTTVTVTTLDFQASDFYIKMGFTEFGKLVDVPKKGTTKHYFVYRL